MMPRFSGHLVVAFTGLPRRRVPGRLVVLCLLSLARELWARKKGDSVESPCEFASFSAAFQFGMINVVMERSLHSWRLTCGRAVIVAFVSPSWARAA